MLSIVGGECLLSQSDQFSSVGSSFVSQWVGDGVGLGAGLDVAEERNSVPFAN